MYDLTGKLWRLSMYQFNVFLTVIVCNGTGTFVLQSHYCRKLGENGEDVPNRRVKRWFFTLRSPKPNLCSKRWCCAHQCSPLPRVLMWLPTLWPPTSPVPTRPYLPPTPVLVCYLPNHHRKYVVPSSPISTTSTDGSPKLSFEGLLKVCHNSLTWSS